MEDLLTVEQLAEALQVKQSWVYRQTMRKGANSIPRMKAGKYLRFNLSAVRAWMETRGMQN